MYVIVYELTSTCPHKNWLAKCDPT